MIGTFMKKNLQRNSNVYGVLENDLRNSICGGRLDYSKPIIGEIELSNRYGISRESVRRAISKLVAEGYLERRRGKGTFVIPPDNKPASPVRNTFSVLVIEPYINSVFNEYKEKFLEGIDSYCHSNNIKAEYAIQSTDADKIIRLHKEGIINGIIWDYPSIKYHETVRNIFNAGIPVLTVSHFIPGIPCVCPDFEDEITTSFDLLRTLGHERIAFVNASLTEFPYEERKKAYFKYADPWQLYRAVSHEDNIIDLPLAEIFSENPSALIVGGYALLAQVLDAVKNKGLALRKDISVICINDSFLARKNIPPVTVYTEDRSEIGIKCIETLRLIASGGKPDVELLKIKGELIWRKSCGQIRN